MRVYLSGTLKKKTRILVTNALQYLPSADHIIVMDQGVIRVSAPSSGTHLLRWCRSPSCEAVGAARACGQSMLADQSKKGVVRKCDG